MTAEAQTPENPPEFVEIPPILTRIAICESGNRQFDRNGQVLRGRVHPADAGRFQINLNVHATTAAMLGFDVFTEEGNTGYALYLYATQGTRPWLASKTCWEKQKRPLSVSRTNSVLIRFSKDNDLTRK